MNLAQIKILLLALEAVNKAIVHSYSTFAEKYSTKLIFFFFGLPV